jgi:hypothetical protein
MPRKNTEQEYFKLARDTCRVLKIDVSQDGSLDSVMGKLEKSVPAFYFTSTQKSAIENLTRIIAAIGKRGSTHVIKRRLKELEDDILFDEYFE